MALDTSKSYFVLVPVERSRFHTYNKKRDDIQHESEGMPGTTYRRHKLLHVGLELVLVLVSVQADVVADLRPQFF